MSKVNELTKRVIREARYFSLGLLTSLFAKEKSAMLAVSILLLLWFAGYIADLIDRI